ncbi:hypothetical protein BSKO_03885 [Bryopsis sp. KO-2023]|nr:hypothetical protein BSKO_03885 [Bryopsis sp. KO-2023]
MTVSKRVQNFRSDKFHGNVHRRGLGSGTAQEKKKRLPVGPVMLAFFLFVVVGSALLQILRTTTSGR